MIDLTNSKVLKNHLLSEAKEGRGKFTYKKEVIVFKNNQGLETVLPDDVAEDVKKLGVFIAESEPVEKPKKKVVEAKVEEPTTEPVEEEIKLEDLSEAELRGFAKTMKIKNYWSKRPENLIEELKQLK